MISDEAVYAAAFAVYRSGFDGSPQKDAWLADFRKALEAAAPMIAAQALSEAAAVLDDLPIENMECYALYEEWKDALNVNHGIQASVRWLNGRAALIRPASDERNPDRIEP